MRILLILVSFSLSLTTAQDQTFTSLPVFFREEAQVWPCDVPDGCPLSLRFAKDDPNGDAFVDNHVFWLYVKNDTDAAAKGESWRHKFLMIDSLKDVLSFSAISMLFLKEDILISKSGNLQVAFC